MHFKKSNLEKDEVREGEREGAEGRGEREEEEAEETL